MNRIPIIATILVALAAATLAAVATSEVAVSTGAVSTPALGWLLPVIIEGGAVTAALLAWRRTSNGLSARPERTALIVLMVLAVCVNAHHATGTAVTGAVLGVALAAAPPLVLVAGIELLLRDRAEVNAGRPAEVPERPQEAPGRPEASAAGESVSKVARGLESALTVSTEQVSNPEVGGEQASNEPSAVSATEASTERSALSAPTERSKVSDRNRSAERSSVSGAGVSGDRPKVSGEKLSTEERRARAEERRARAAQALAEDPDLTGPRLAALIGGGDSTARKLLAQLRKQAAA